MQLLSEAKLRALSQTLLDFAKVLLAALVAADFIKFTTLIKIIIIVGLFASVVVGLTIRPDKEGD
jgi:hypothetical protein